MNHLVDIHTHILPGIDDGSESMEESERMLEIARNEGISTVFCTPHNHPNKGQALPGTIERSVAMLQETASRYGIRLVAGNEIFYTLETPEKLRRGENLPIDGYRTVLVEFGYGDTYNRIRNAVTHIQTAGFDVLMAHCERYQALVCDMEAVYDLDRMGVLFQVNSDSISGDMGRKIRKFVKKMLSEGLVYCVGSDAHSKGFRSPRMAQAYKYVSKKYGQTYADEIFAENARKFIH